MTIVVPLPTDVPCAGARVRSWIERRFLPHLGEPLVAVEEGLQHEGHQLGHGLRLAVGRPIEAGILAKRLVQRGCEGDGNPDRRPVGQLGEPQFGHDEPPQRCCG